MDILLACFIDDASAAWVRLDVQVHRPPPDADGKWWKREVARVRAAYGIVGMPLILREKMGKESVS